MIKKLQMEKIDVAAKYHDIVGMLDTHLIQGEVDVMIPGGNINFFHLEFFIILGTSS